MMCRPEKGRSLLHLLVHFRMYEKVIPLVPAAAGHAGRLALGIYRLSGTGAERVWISV